MTGDAARPAKEFTGFFKPLAGGAIGPQEFLFPGDMTGAFTQTLNLSEGGMLKVRYPFVDGGWGFERPTEWGQRRAPGELQLAISDLVQAEAKLKKALKDYDGLIAQIEDAKDVLEAENNLHAEEMLLKGLDKELRPLRSTQSSLAPRPANSILSSEQNLPTNSPRLWPRRFPRRSD